MCITRGKCFFLRIHYYLYVNNEISELMKQNLQHGKACSKFPNKKGTITPYLQISSIFRARIRSWLNRQCKFSGMLYVSLYYSCAQPLHRKIVPLRVLFGAPEGNCFL